MFRFTLINHLCRDMEQVHDTSRPPDRIRQDVSRSPGGDSRIFLNNCIGCHSGMDPMAQAFAYYDFDETQSRLVYTPGAVNAQVLHQRRTTSSRASSRRTTLGEPLAPRPELAARLERLAPRQRQRREVARRGARHERRVRGVPGPEGLQGGVLPRAAAADPKSSAITASFKASGYHLRQVFAETAARCMGQ